MVEYLKISKYQENLLFKTENLLEMLVFKNSFNYAFINNLAKS